MTSTASTIHAAIRTIVVGLVSALLGATLIGTPPAGATHVTLHQLDARISTLEDKTQHLSNEGDLKPQGRVLSYCGIDIGAPAPDDAVWKPTDPPEYIVFQMSYLTCPAP